MWRNIRERDEEKVEREVESEIEKDEKRENNIVIRMKEAKLILSNTESNDGSEAKSMKDTDDSDGKNSIVIR